MAEPKKLQKTLPGKVSAKVSTHPVVELPDDIVEENLTLDDYGILIYGQTGIGKSSLPSSANKPFYFRFEQSSRSLKVFKTPVLTDWAMALSYLEAAERNLKEFKTMIIDTGAPCYDRCLESVCNRLGIKHPGTQKDYGASWKEVQKEFQQFFNRLASLNVGIWVMAHETTETNQTRSGDTYTTIQPNFGGKTMEFFKSCMDIIGYYCYVLDQRFLLIRGNDHIMAKCNLENNFKTPAGESVVAIPMGNTKEEAFQNFITAYHNKQTETNSQILMKGGLQPQMEKQPVKKQPIKKT